VRVAIKSEGNFRVSEPLPGYRLNDRRMPRRRTTDAPSTLVSGNRALSYSALRGVSGTATSSVENDAWVIRYFTSCTCQKERDWQSAISPNIGLSVFDNGEASYASVNAARAAKSGI
jgi:hypothetical protein